MNFLSAWWKFMHISFSELHFCHSDYIVPYGNQMCMQVHNYIWRIINNTSQQQPLQGYVFHSVSAYYLSLQLLYWQTQ
jgi:hypothetical protein